MSYVHNGRLTIIFYLPGVETFSDGEEGDIDSLPESLGDESKGRKNESSKKEKDV